MLSQGLGGVDRPQNFSCLLTMATSIAGKLTHLISPKVPCNAEFAVIERSPPLLKRVLIDFDASSILTLAFPPYSSLDLPKL